MVDFSLISPQSFPGRLLRFPLKLVPKSATVRILQGPLQGHRWIAGSATHGCWLGGYEKSKQQRFASALQNGSVVYDIGANVGFYTLLAAKCVGVGGRVHAFEPLPENLAFLGRHVELNRLTNVTIHKLALSDVSKTLWFDPGSNRCQGHLSEKGSLQVQAMTLDDFVFEGRHSPPYVMKIDVEGAEGDVLRGASRVLKTKQPIIFLATHGANVHQECCELLRSFGYRLEGIAGDAVEMTDEIFAVPSR